MAAFPASIGETHGQSEQAASVAPKQAKLLAKAAQQCDNRPLVGRGSRGPLLCNLSASLFDAIVFFMPISTIAAVAASSRACASATARDSVWKCVGKSLGSYCQNRQLRLWIGQARRDARWEEMECFRCFRDFRHYFGFEIRVVLGLRIHRVRAATARVEELIDEETRAVMELERLTTCVLTRWQHVERCRSQLKLQNPNWRLIWLIPQQRYDDKSCRATAHRASSAGSTARGVVAALGEDSLVVLATIAAALGSDNCSSATSFAGLVILTLGIAHALDNAEDALAHCVLALRRRRAAVAQVGSIRVALDDALSQALDLMM